MGNSINKDKLWSHKSDLIEELQEHHKSIASKQSIIQNCDHRLEIICSSQRNQLRKYYKQNKQLKQENQSTILLPKPNVCEGKVVALSRFNEETCQEYWQITELHKHTCQTQEYTHNSIIKDSTKNASSKVKDKLLVLSSKQVDTKHVGSILCNEYNLDKESSAKLPYMVKYRVKKEVINQSKGDLKTQYSTLLHVLESMKQFDKESIILLKVFPDTEDYLIRKGTRGKPSTYGKRFALRFGSVSVIPGSSIRRRSIDKRKVLTADATHITNIMRGSIQSLIAPLADSEQIIEAYSVDAENESINTWNFLLSSIAEYNMLNASNVIVCDRLKGQIQTMERIIPTVNVDNCVLHLFMNLTDKRRMSKNLKKDFEKIFLAHSIEECSEAIDTLRRKISNQDELREYFDKSICDPEQLSRFADSHIMSNNSRVREGIRTAQLNESFHNSIIDTRDEYKPRIISDLFGYNYRRLNTLHSLYTKHCQDGIIIPPKQQLLIDSNKVMPERCEYVVTSKHCHTLYEADVSVRKRSDPRVHRITINPQQHKVYCSHRCEDRFGTLCSNALYFLHVMKMDYKQFIPFKYTIEGGCEFLSTSLGNCKDKDFTLSTSVHEMPVSCPNIVPPHVRTPKGRKQTKRITKTTRLQSFVNSNREKANERNTNIIFHEENTNPRRVTKKCTFCGCGGHDSRSCDNATNGRGVVMTTDEQNLALNNGFLIINIQTVGQTQLPQNEEEFHTMREQQIIDTINNGTHYQYMSHEGGNHDGNRDGNHHDNNDNHHDFTGNDTHVEVENDIDNNLNDVNMNIDSIEMNHNVRHLPTNDRSPIYTRLRKRRKEGTNDIVDELRDGKIIEM